MVIEMIAYSDVQLVMGAIGGEAVEALSSWCGCTERMKWLSGTR